MIPNRRTPPVVLSFGSALSLVVALLVLAGSIVPLSAGRAPAQSGLPAVTARIVDDWGSGHQGALTITNPGPAAIDNWVLEFDFAAEIPNI